MLTKRYGVCRCDSHEGWLHPYRNNRTIVAHPEGGWWGDPVELLSYALNQDRFAVIPETWTLPVKWSNALARLGNGRHFSQIVESSRSGNHGKAACLGDFHLALKLDASQINRVPIWMIETFGGKQLDTAFLYLLLMTAPFWIGMIAIPKSRLVEAVSTPFLAPLLYLPVLAYIIWNAWQSALLPSLFSHADYQSVRGFVRHPVSFLALFCKFQILNLIVGTLIYQKARQVGLFVPVELLIGWVLGPIAILPFSIRLLLKGKSLRL